MEIRTERSQNTDSLVRIQLKVDKNLSNDEVLKILQVEAHRNFSNYNVKNEMLKDSINYLRKNLQNSKNYLELLDLASGRGNDLNRWIINKVDSVIGIDISPEQVEEANKRFAETPSNKKKNIKVSYFIGSIDNEKDVNRIVSNKKFYLITNNYALNYVNLDKFLKLISDKLMPKGLFIGTATDGSTINALIQAFGPEINSRLFYLKGNVEGITEGTTSFPNIESLEDFLENSERIPELKTYDFKLETAFFNDDTINENIVYRDEFEKIAKKYGLIPFSTSPYVNPIYNLNRRPLQKQYMYRPESIASLYFGFSFIKADQHLLKNINEPTGIIIIPYRDREEYLMKLLDHFKKIGIKNDVLIARQIDNKKFNRGALINSAIASIKNSPRTFNYNYYIIHDVDLLPDEDLVPYYKKYPVNPIHIGARGQRYSSINSSPILMGWEREEDPRTLDEYFIYSGFLGGILSISKEHFYRINGFPNNLFGWGSEDNVLRNRLNFYSIGYIYPEKGSVTDLENIFNQRKIRTN